MGAFMKTCGLALFILILNGCLDDSTLILKDPRAYTFTREAISDLDWGLPQFYDIAGTSVSNVYAVGFNGNSAGTMYRFDGKSWKTTRFHEREGGPISG